VPDEEPELEPEDDPEEDPDDDPDEDPDEEPDDEPELELPELDPDPEPLLPPADPSGAFPAGPEPPPQARGRPVVNAAARSNVEMRWCMRQAHRNPRARREIAVSTRPRAARVRSIGPRRDRSDRSVAVGPPMSDAVRLHAVRCGNPRVTATGDTGVPMCAATSYFTITSSKYVYVASPA